jgi:hypothetical protein
MKAKIFTLLILGMMFLSASLGQAQNILTDGEFSTTTAINNYFNQPEPDNVWYSWQNWQINNDVTVDGGVCHYEVVSLGAEKNTWDIQLIQKGFPLILGHSYRLTFDVKADADRSFGLFLGENGGNWTSIIGYDNYAQFATTYWKTRTIDFVATAVFSSHKLSFELGAEQVATYFDNVMLVDMGLSIPSIGIVGTALNGWEVDVDMETIDGINYTLLNYPLAAGEAKFRQDNTWSVNWGNSSFPSGTAHQNGPNIPILGFGNYDISFNRLTGDYSFVCISNCATIIQNIGILGSALIGWDDDVNMLTSDGIIYTLKNYTFKEGDAKFRQDDDWNINWGNNTFPTGKALLDGLNIPVKAGTFDVTFNIVTGDYSFTPPIIGIVGSALAGWDLDVDMQTSDGITFTLMNYYFGFGEVKFRLSHSWDINWGNNTFPTGIGLPYGSNIPVQPGNYNVTFNRITGEYTFTVVCFPIIQCPTFVQVNTDPGKCGAVVNYPEVVADVTCGDEQVTIKQTAGLASGSYFPIGFTWNAFEFTNSQGKTAACGFSVYVADPPQIKSIPDLWPPNHKMVPIHLDFINNCIGNTTVKNYYIYDITSNEPDNGLGDGDVANDWQIDMYGQNLLLRAERSGKGTGRVYSFYVSGYDEFWNYFNQMVTVTVPHDQGKAESITSTPIPIVTNHKATLGDASFESIPFASNVWPNPSSGDFKLEIQSSSNENAVLSIFDINGRLISNVNVGNQQTISFGENLKAGIYMVVVRQGNNFNTFKVVKQ